MWGCRRPVLFWGKSLCGVVPFACALRIFAHYAKFIQYANSRAGNGPGCGPWIPIHGPHPGYPRRARSRTGHPPPPGEQNPHGLHSPFRWRRIRTRRRTAFRVTPCRCEAFHLWPKPRGDVLLRITYPGVGVIAGATGGGPVLRIHMSGVDLSKVRMATRPDALWETALSFHRLRDRRGSAVFGKWRTETRPRLNGEVRLLSAVIPPRGYFPDFLTPSQESGEPYGIDAGMQALRETPPGRVRAELALLGAERRDAYGSQDGRTEAPGGSSTRCAPTTAPPSSRTGRTSGPASRPTAPSAAAPSWTAARTSCSPPSRR